MKALRAHVKNGQIVLDDAAELPDGASVEVRLLEVAGDDLSAEQGADLERAIEEGAQDFERGEFEDARAFALRLAAKQ